MQYKEANTRRFKKGQFVFIEGDDAFEAYIVLLGSVEISIGKGKERKVLDVIHENQMFGEMGVIADIPRTATGRCLEDTELVIVDRSLIESKIKAMDPYIKYLMESLIDRLFRTSRWTEPKPKCTLEIMPRATEYALSRESENSAEGEVVQDKKT